MTVITETTDAPATRLTPYRMFAGDEFRGTLGIGGHDWIAVTLNTGQTYSFGAVGLGVLNSGITDPEIFLRGPGGRVLAFDDDSGPGTSAGLTFTAAATGTYFVDVKALDGAPDGAYGLSMTLGDRVSYGVELGAAELYRDGSSWAVAPAAGVTLTYGFRSTGPATDADGVAAPFHRLTVAQVAATQAALANFSDVSNLAFAQVSPGGFTNHATILVGAYTSTTDGAGAFANFPGLTRAASPDGDLWINTDSVSANRLPAGSYSAYVMLHELGHAMGLDHPGDYNAAPGLDITYQNDAQFREDSGQYSVMSYFDATETAPGAPPHFAQTLMLYDIYAVQQMYGVNLATQAGDSTYGFNSTVGGVFNFASNRAPLLCIWDGGGVDKLDVSGFAQAQSIDLNAGHFSDIGGFRQNVSIALGCAIENASGGRGADTMMGSALANRMFGRDGDDTLIGNAGNDRLVGNAGADHFVFSAGSGRDIVADFGALDMLDLDASLWGGLVKTAQEVVSQFVRMAGGHVVLDFGTDEIALLPVTTDTGLADHILIG